MTTISRRIDEAEAAAELLQGEPNKSMYVSNGPAPIRCEQHALLGMRQLDSIEAIGLQCMHFECVAMREGLDPFTVRGAGHMGCCRNLTCLGCD